MPSPLIDMVGKTFGRLTPIRYAGGKRWLCICQCGSEVQVAGQAMRSGRFKSCGCLKRGLIGEKSRKHGDAVRGAKTTEYFAWQSIRRRCFNQNNSDYPYYGARGIKVCERWAVFENFLADMGRKPTPKHSIDRIDNDGDYEPKNCRWATRVEQTRNRRTSPKIMYRGELRPVGDVAELVGVSASVIGYRLLRGWTDEEALAPPRRTRPIRHSSAGELILREARKV